MNELLEYVSPHCDVTLLFSDSLLNDSVYGDIDESGWGD